MTPPPACLRPGTLCDVHNYLMQRQRRQPFPSPRTSTQKEIEMFPAAADDSPGLFFTLSTRLLRLHRTVVYFPLSYLLALSGSFWLPPHPQPTPLAITSGK
uniref:Uncharacterized protein n=1 Tax=Suricata suricatta TaxID=37032 RepID=A0A673TH82_SURSU